MTTVFQRKDITNVPDAAKYQNSSQMICARIVNAKKAMIKGKIMKNKIFILLPLFFLMVIILSACDSYKNYDKYGEYVDAKQLKHFDVPAGETEIGDYEFLNCSILESVTIPNSVTKIGENAFVNCDNLKTIVIPNSVTVIEREAFSNCRNLTNVIIPDSVTSIGFEAFADCKNLKSITLGKGIIFIGEDAFDGIERINVPDLKTYCQIDYGYDKIDNSFGYLSERIYIDGVSLDSLSTLTIPEGVERIGIRAFGRLMKLKQVNLPNSLREIGCSAFCGSSVEIITFPSNLRLIGQAAFRATNLTRVVIPDSVTQIGQCAFMECDIADLTLGKGLTNINFNTFASNHIGVLIIPDSIKIIGTSAFSEGGVSITVLPTSVTSVGAGASLGDIYYLGTEEEYRKLSLNSKGLGWNDVYIYMKNQPTKYGDYWHYDSKGNPVRWYDDKWNIIEAN